MNLCELTQWITQSMKTRIIALGCLYLKPTNKQTNKQNKAEQQQKLSLAVNMIISQTSSSKKNKTNLQKTGTVLGSFSFSPVEMHTSS